MSSGKKYFPITQGIPCQSKWAWSTLYLHNQETRSCHRASFSPLTVDNFDNFHNTDVKIRDRQTMLRGEWPGNGCEYCRGIEQVGGLSDRMLHLTIPDLSPPELETDPTAVNITPTILEVFFSNTCNLSCLYCMPEVSSQIAAEYQRHGKFDQSGVKLIPLTTKRPADLQEKFWEWMKANFQNLKRFHFLGGEPFIQREFQTLLEFIDQHPNPNCEVNFITNLQVPAEKFISQIEQIRQLVARRKISRLDITASIDCWGPEQEYVRSGMSLGIWSQNFDYLLAEKWIKLNINQTISALTIKTMPELLNRLAGWRKTRSVGHYFSVTEPGPSYLRPNIFGPGVFDSDFDKVLELMPEDNDSQISSKKYMSGIADDIKQKTPNILEIKKLFVFLTEIDRRRGTDWRTTFPWLQEYDHVV